MEQMTLPYFYVNMSCQERLHLTDESNNQRGWALTQSAHTMVETYAGKTMPCLYYILTYISLNTNSVSCGHFQSLHFTSVYQKKKERLKIYAQNIKHSKYPRYLDDFPKTSDFIHIFPPHSYTKLSFVELCCSSLEQRFTGFIVLSMYNLSFKSGLYGGDGDTCSPIWEDAL